MDNQIEIILSLTIIILAILAIVVYIYTGPNLGFYGIFVVALIVMFYTWRRASQAPTSMAQKARAAPRKRGANRGKK